MSLAGTATARHHPISVPGRGLLLWGLWLTYGSFYFCRNNLGPALPGVPLLWIKVNRLIVILK